MQRMAGSNETRAVVGRILDCRDSADLFQVRFEPFYDNNCTVINGKCDSGCTTKVADTW